MTENQRKYYQKLKQKKYRDTENKFLIEGIHLIEECLASEYYSDNIEKIIVSSAFDDLEFIKKIQNSHPSIEVVSIDETKFKSLSETVTSQGIIAVVSKHEKIISENLSNNSSLVLALDNINDPGNLGTILRTAYWFAVNEILISRDSADIFNSKVLRASQGAVFNLKINEEVKLEDMLKKFNEDGYMILLTDLTAGMYISQFDITQKNKLVIVFGNEANGITKLILDNPLYEKIKIKGLSRCESLNVAVAAGIILYELSNAKY